MSVIVQSIEAQPRAWPGAQAAAGRGVSATINAKLRKSSARNRIRVRPPFTTGTHQPAFPLGPSGALILANRRYNRAFSSALQFKLDAIADGDPLQDCWIFGGELHFHGGPIDRRDRSVID